MESSDVTKENSNRRIERAVEHTERMWFPVNGEIFSRIKKGLREGAYDLDLQFLIDEIRQDFALFIHVIRKLKDVMGEEVSSDTNPFELLRKAGLSRLKKILLVEERDISTHSLEGSSEIQEKRLKEVAIVAGTVDALCDNLNVDGEIGFSSAVLRQLGMCLVAWNYPTVYQRVIEGEVSEASLDEKLSKALGFSPAFLAETLLIRWEVSPTLVGSKDVPESEKELSATLDHLCDVGEALARANDPQLYPTALHDWEEARDEISRILGEDGLRKVTKRVRDVSDGYLKRLPKSFVGLTMLDPERAISEITLEKITKINPFVKRCGHEIQMKLKRIYMARDEGTSHTELVRMLVKDVVPNAGFSGGVIYALDPALNALVPRLKIGSVVTREIATVNQDAGDDPVIAAYRCSAPIIENRVLSGKREELFIAASLGGGDNKVGVLYLEAPRQAFEDSTNNTLTLFKAIRQTLAHCLGITE